MALMYFDENMTIIPSMPLRNMLTTQFKFLIQSLMIIFCKFQLLVERL